MPKWFKEILWWQLTEKQAKELSEWILSDPNEAIQEIELQLEENLKGGIPT